MTWINFVSRDISLTAIYYANRAHNSGQYFDFGTKHTFNFSVGTYLKGFERDDELKNLLSCVLLLVKEKKVEAILKEFLEIIRERDELTAAFVQTDLASISKDELASLLTGFGDFYIRYWSYHLIGFYLGKAVEGTDFENVLVELDAIITPIRHAHPFHSFDEEFLPHLARFVNKEFGIEESLVGFMTLPELASLVKTGVFDKKEIQLRSECYLMRFVDGDSVIIAGQRARAEFERLVPPEEIPMSDQLAGKVVFKGKAKGQVKIIRLKNDFSKIGEGDILITSMTTPDFLPVMKKAAAIVTDEGGVTSHAAIVARELGKPCVIGTKVATKVFKDGDLVEVDAVNGVVRRVE